ncbi:MAG: radical SAM protein [Chloroflexi bacterium]|nr:radical SAM protein [Chloroflexota bacterium]
MLKAPALDANSFSLDRRNFDLLPDAVAQDWRSEFLHCRRGNRPKPTRLIVEIFNSCNLDCPMCRVGQYGIDYSRLMSVGDFTDIIDQLDSLKEVRLNGLGESTLVHNLKEYIDVLSQRSIKTELVTNGTGEFDDYKYIIDRGGSIFFSWDAATKAIFEKLRRPARWKKVFETLQKVSEHASASHIGNVGLIFTLQKLNVSHFSGVIQMAADLKVQSVQMNVIKKGANEWIKDSKGEISYEINKACEISKRHRIKLFVPSQISGTALAGCSSSTAGSHCLAPTHETVIRWNGDVQVCNMFNPYVLGSALDDNFMNSWNSAFAELFLRRLNSNAKHPYCINCVYMPQAYA